MNYQTENSLWKIKLSILENLGTGGTLEEAERLVAPLVWYVSTGRCSGSVSLLIGKLTKRQQTTIAKRLISANAEHGGVYHYSVKACLDYLHKLLGYEAYTEYKKREFSL